MKKWILVGALIFLFIASVFCGFMINSYINFSKKKDKNIAILAENTIGGESVDTTYVEETVSPNAIVIITEIYKKCGHTITKREEVPREIVNLNEEKVKEYYKDWNVDEFSSEEIKISREKNGICDEHYILRESDGYISISAKNDIGEFIFKALTDIPVQYLPEEDYKNLEKGIEIVGKDNLNKFLEDFE
jgi:hypothetical protein